MSDFSKVSRWLLTLPGQFTGDSKHDVLLKAWAAAGVQISLTDFTDELPRCGYEPKPVRVFKHGASWHLNLPSSGIPKF